MAQKKIYMYAVLIGNELKAEKTMYVQARNAERAESFVRRWLKRNRVGFPHGKVQAVRWEKELPAGTEYHNESEIPWDAEG